MKLSFFSASLWMIKANMTATAVLQCAQQCPTPREIQLLRLKQVGITPSIPLSFSFSVLAIQQYLSVKSKSPASSEMLAFDSFYGKLKPSNLTDNPPSPPEIKQIRPSRLRTRARICPPKSLIP
jgi:hypothetical protein